ncbi:MAG: DUF748 domain-containing protein [Nitrospirota bacterium]
MVQLTVMQNRRKRVVVALSVAIVVVLAVTLVIINANKILKRELEKAMGSNFSVERISVGLRGVDAYGLRFRKGGRDSIVIDRLTIRADLIGIVFKRNYSVGSLIAENPRVHLTIDKEGNFVNPFASGERKEKGTSGTVVPAFDIHRIRINGGELYLKDERLPDAYNTITMENRSIALDGFSYPLPSGSAKIEVSALFRGRLVSGELACSGKINVKTGGLDLTTKIKNLALFDMNEKGPAMQAANITFAIASSKESPKRYIIPDLAMTRPFVRIETDRKGDIVDPLHLLGGNGNGKNGNSNKNGLSVLMKEITINDGEVLYLDGKIAQPPHPVRLEAITWKITDFTVPFENRWTRYAFAARIPGKLSTATLRWEGKTNCKTLDTDAKVVLNGLDITGFKPYYRKEGDADTVRGTLGISMDLNVRSRALNAPGSAVLRDIAFATGKGYGDKFLGAPRSMVIRLLKSGNNEIALAFVVTGSLDDPQFDIKENFARRIAVSLAKSLGLTVVDAGKTVIGLGAKGVQQVGKGVIGIGKGIGSLFKKR